MEDKIEVGEYARTNLGNIFIFAWVENANGIRYEDKVILIKDNRVTNEFYYFKENEKIVKHSKNIIDIIEVGDVLKIQRGLYSKSKIIIEDEDTLISIQENIKKCNIKSIVTHEQFESVEYKV